MHSCVPRARSRSAVPKSPLGHTLYTSVQLFCTIRLLESAMTFAAQPARRSRPSPSPQVLESTVSPLSSSQAHVSLSALLTRAFATQPQKTTRSPFVCHRSETTLPQVLCLPQIRKTRGEDVFALVSDADPSFKNEFPPDATRPAFPSLITYCSPYFCYSAGALQCVIFAEFPAY
jgi:hypothetical protein